MMRGYIFDRQNGNGHNVQKQKQTRQKRTKNVFLESQDFFKCDCGYIDPNPKLITLQHLILTRVIILGPGQSYETIPNVLPSCQTLVKHIARGCFSSRKLWFNFFTTFTCRYHCTIYKKKL